MRPEVAAKAADGLLFLLENYSMQINRDQIGDLEVRLTITLEKDDYMPKYESSLKRYRKQVNMPGFRPGHVPLGLIKKQYGPSILAEELNQAVNDKLYRYIIDEKLNVLGNPIPADGDEVQGDFRNPDTFTFQYDLGLAPEIDLEKALKKAPTMQKAKVDKKLLEKNIEDLQRRHGDIQDVESAEENDLLVGTFAELDETGNVKEDGISNESTIGLEFLDDKKLRKALTGSKVGDAVEIDPHKLSKDHDEVADKLGITHEQVHDLKSNFKFTVKEVKRIDKAEINEDLFKKVFGEETEVKTEEEFRAKLTEELENMFDRDAKNIYKRKLSNHIIDKLEAPLPDAFLKRWIQMSNENPITDEQVEQEYPDYAKYLRWQLVEGKIMREHQLQVTEEEVREQAKAMLSSQYAQYGMPIDGELLDKFADNYLSDQKERQRVSDVLKENKVLDQIIDDLDPKVKEVSFDDFKKWADED